MAELQTDLIGQLDKTGPFLLRIAANQQSLWAVHALFRFGYLSETSLVLHVSVSISRPSPLLFNIFVTADVGTPGCRPVSANVIPYSIIN